MNGVTFGCYQLVECIGRGGMGEVFRAKRLADPTTDDRQPCGLSRLVALKRIHKDKAQDRALAAMFIDEARIAALLSHPNIAQVLDFGEIDGQYFIAFEHIHGRDLRALYLRHRIKSLAVPMSKACYIALEACQGLDYAHSRLDCSGHRLDLVHRDISPQNLLLSFDGELKIIDFGIAKAGGRTVTTERGWIKGKMKYMSPEQMRGLHTDHRSDIFSLGVVFFELLTGRRLFQTEDMMEIVKQVRNAQVPAPSQCNPAIPSALDKILLRALQANPDHRYQSAGEFYDALMPFVQRTGLYRTRNQVADWLRGLYAEDYAAEKARSAALWAADSVGTGLPRPARGAPHASAMSQSGTLPGWTPAVSQNAVTLSVLHPQQHEAIVLPVEDAARAVSSAFYDEIECDERTGRMARRGAKLCLPLPPSPEESGEISLAELPPQKTKWTTSV